MIKEGDVRSGRPGWCQRPFDFDPAHDHPGLSLGRGQGILGPTRARTGAEKPSGVDLDAFAGLKRNVQFVHGGVRIEVHITDSSKDTRGSQSVDRDRFRTMAFGNIVEIRHPPANRPLGRRQAGADPDGLSAKFDPVAARHRRPEGTKVRLHRFIRTMHDPHAFFIPYFFIRLTGGQRCVAPSDLRLSGETERRKRRSFGRLIEF